MVVLTIWACIVTVVAACVSRPTPPKVPAESGTTYNGVELPEVCYDAAGEEHFFIIGDWGGVYTGGPGSPPRPADNRGPGKAKHRPFVVGVDERAQQLVAEQMELRAAVSKPRFVVNVGDNFYWGGIDAVCGNVSCCSTSQFQDIYETVYSGPNLAGKPWLGVLGNHDYGGWSFTKAWDQQIGYTWVSDRWVTPSLYWSQAVRYANFTVDFLFVDTNVFDAHQPHHDPTHNICSLKHNGPTATCGTQGPLSAFDCYTWFQDLWRREQAWLEQRLNASEADWKVVVSHFPPTFGDDVWTRLNRRYHIDLVISGHTHWQQVHKARRGLPAFVVSGGGGGITTEGQPHKGGQDDMYGFMDVTLRRENLTVVAISHGGVVRKTLTVLPRGAVTTTTTTTTTTLSTTATTQTTNTEDMQPHHPSLHPPSSGKLIDDLHKRQRHSDTKVATEPPPLNAALRGAVVWRPLAIVALAISVRLASPLGASRPLEGDS